MENKKGIVGERISELLDKQGLTQRDLAIKADITQVSMSRYIRGDRTPKADVVARIASILHTTSDYLLGQEESLEDPELEYYRAQRIIARCAKNWTPKQKANLVNALFEVEL